MHARPDFLYATVMLAKYNHNPGLAHIKAVRRIFKYVRGSLNRGITYSANGCEDIQVYSNTDYAGQIDGRKSTAGYVCMLAGGPISHYSKQQSSVVLSSCEAEYIGLTEAGKEVIWLSRLLTEFGHRQEKIPVRLNGDNQGSLALAVNPEHHRRTKHIDVRHHWIRGAVEDGFFKLAYIPTKLMIADGLTKALGPQDFAAFVRMLNMTSKQVPEES